MAEVRLNILWRGNWVTRARLLSGLVLFVFVLFHFLNIGLGLISHELMERAQGWRLVVTRSLPGTMLMMTAMLVHFLLALMQLAGRRTLRMPPWQALQVISGLAVPPLLAAHVVFVRLAHELFGVNDRMGYLVALIWNTPSAWKQALLLLIVWSHVCMGLHFWLRLRPWWQRALPAMTALAVLVPAFALAGFVAEGRYISAQFADPQARAALMAAWNWPEPDAFARLGEITQWALWGFWAMVGLALVDHAARRLVNRLGHRVTIRYVDGPEITAPEGPTLLEISRMNGVPHMALCGGRGRCTTCRVIVEEGAENLPPPSPAEQASLKAVNAPPGSRLACQLRPCGRITVFRVFRADGRRRRAHAVQGQERRLAILFLDMRGFTERTAGQLPYDVVFLLNRFFDAIVPAITAAGGTVDKYLGDGLLAVFETEDETSSARAALRAAADIGTALEQFNRDLAIERAPSVRIGMGLHLGTLVLGEIGAAGAAPRTIIGDTVNIASRLEAMTKELNVVALVSRDLLEAAGARLDGLDLVALDLRGVSGPIRALPVPDPGVLAALPGLTA